MNNKVVLSRQLVRQQVTLVCCEQSFLQLSTKNCHLECLMTNWKVESTKNY